MVRLQRNRQLRNPVKKILDYPTIKSSLLTNLGLAYLLYKAIKPKDKKVVVKKSTNQQVAHHLKTIVASLVRQGKSDDEVKSIITYRGDKKQASVELLVEILKSMVWNAVKLELGRDFETVDDSAIDVAFEIWLNYVTSDDVYLDYALSSPIDDIVSKLKEQNLLKETENEDDT